MRAVSVVSEALEPSLYPAVKSATIFILGIFLTGFLAGLGAYHIFGKRPGPNPPTLQPPAPVFIDTSAAEINTLHQNLIALREKNTLDSLRRLDSLASIWAINFYIQYGRFPSSEAVPEKYRRHP